MQVTKEQLEPTKVKLVIIADKELLDNVKQTILNKLSKDAKVPGFRPGKAPAAMVEKSIDPGLMQSEFIDQVVNQLFIQAIEQEKLRPVSQPQISLTKFVPYSTVEFSAEVEVVGDVKLADYKKIKLEPKKAQVTAKDVNDVLEQLRKQAATKKDVTRAAKAGDELTIDFKGTDAKTNEAIAGAEGKDYPLLLGSKNFIPGFEEALIGTKPGQKKTFDLTFPADYGSRELQNRKVKFDVQVVKAQELILPEIDDAFAASIGPFKTLADLKADIKKQLTAEKQQEANRSYDNELLEKIAAKSTVAIPAALVDEEIDRIEEEEKRNIVYRGQTWQEHLAAEGLTAEEHREKQREGAELRVKAGLVLGEIADKEQVNVSPDELEIRIELLKGQYKDDAMQAELDKPENRRDIRSRMMTEKTLDKLRTYATKT